MSSRASAASSGTRRVLLVATPPGSIVASSWPGWEPEISQHFGLDPRKLPTPGNFRADPPAANEETRSRFDKSILALREAKRLRDKQHLRFVAKQPCLRR